MSKYHPTGYNPVLSRGVEPVIVEQELHPIHDMGTIRPHYCAGSDTYRARINGVWYQFDTAEEAAEWQREHGLAS